MVEKDAALGDCYRISWFSHSSDMSWLPKARVRKFAVITMKVFQLPT